MKAAILLLPLALAACGAYHTGRIGATIDAPDIRFVPKQAKISVSENKITGTAKCSSTLWVFNSAPERQVFGPELQTSAGNFASPECTAGAMYDAVSKANADILVAPQYTTVRNGVLCFGHRCLFGTTQVIVNGYSGKITSVTDMDADVVKELQKSGAGRSSGDAPQSGGLLSLFK